MLRMCIGWAFLGAMDQAAFAKAPNEEIAAQLQLSLDAGERAALDRHLTLEAWALAIAEAHPGADCPSPAAFAKEAVSGTFGLDMIGASGVFYRPRGGSVRFWAKPGTTDRVYYRSFVADGSPIIPYAQYFELVVVPEGDSFRVEDVTDFSRGMSTKELYLQRWRDACSPPDDPAWADTRSSDDVTKFQAIGRLGEPLRSRPDLVAARSRAAILHSDLREEAAVDARERLKSTPFGSVIPLYHFSNLGRYDDALGCLDGIEHEVGPDPALDALRSYFLARKSATKEAITAAQSALTAEPKTPGMSAVLAFALASDGQVEAALDHMPSGDLGRALADGTLQPMPRVREHPAYAAWRASQPAGPYDALVATLQADFHAYQSTTLDDGLSQAHLAEDTTKALEVVGTDKWGLPKYEKIWRYSSECPGGAEKAHAAILAQPPIGTRLVEMARSAHGTGKVVLLGRRGGGDGRILVRVHGAQGPAYGEILVSLDEGKPRLDGYFDWQTGVTLFERTSTEFEIGCLGNRDPRFPARAAAAQGRFSDAWEHLLQDPRRDLETLVFAIRVAAQVGPEALDEAVDRLHAAALDTPMEWWAPFPAYVAQGRFDDALRCIDRLETDFVGADSSLAYLRASVALARNDLAAAAKNLEEAVRREPKNHAITAASFGVLLAANDFAGIVRILRLHDPQDRQAYVSLMQQDPAFATFLQSTEFGSL